MFIFGHGAEEVPQLRQQRQGYQVRMFSAVKVHACACQRSPTAATHALEQGTNGWPGLLHLSCSRAPFHDSVPVHASKDMTCFAMLLAVQKWLPDLMEGPAMKGGAASIACIGVIHERNLQRMHGRCGPHTNMHAVPLQVDPKFQGVVDLIRSGHFGYADYFTDILNNVTTGSDYYLVANDFPSYVEAQVSCTHTQGAAGHAVRMAQAAGCSSASEVTTSRAAGTWVVGIGSLRRLVHNAGQRHSGITRPLCFIRIPDQVLS